VRYAAGRRIDADHSTVTPITLVTKITSDPPALFITYLIYSGRRAMRVFKGYVSDYVKSLDPNEVLSKLPVHKKVLFKLLGVVKVEDLLVETPSGTKSRCSIYLARCGRCKAIYVDYPHGYDPHLVCPKCGTWIYV